MRQASSGGARLTCVALALDLRSLYQFGRKLVQAGQRPILANRLPLATEFATRFGLNMIVVQVPQGNVALAVREIVQQLLQGLPDARVVLEVPDETTEFPTGVSQMGAVHYFCRSDGPARVKAVIDVATFSDGLVGSVAKLDLVDYLQLLTMAHHTRALQIRGAYAGEVLVREGQIVHAACGVLTGELALYKLLGQRSGSFVEVAMPPAPPQTIAGRADMLLLEAMRLRDEAAHGVVTRDAPVVEEKAPVADDDVANAFSTLLDD